VNEDTIQNVACGAPTRLETVSTLEEALADSTVSLAFSRRKGKGRPALPSLSAFLQGDDGWMGRGEGSEGSEGGEERGEAMALVFGREESGLVGIDLDRRALALRVP
jgi:tRNA C32,U32 (ribose-2'-O)-methylase TrmJ